MANPDMQSYGSISLSSSIPTAGEIIKDGWVQKQGNVVKNWRKRWAVLVGQQLMLYEQEPKKPSQPGRTLRTVIAIADAFIWPAPNKRNAICIDELGDGKRVLLNAPDANKRREWIEALTYAALPVYVAARDGDLDAVKAYLRSRVPKLSVRDCMGRTPLYMAARYAHFDVVKILVETRVADVNCVTKTGVTPLIATSLYGGVDIMQLLLQHGARVEHGDSSGMTPLAYAVYGNQISACEVLVNAGASVTASRLDGTTPLFFAAQNGFCECCQWLLAHGASVNSGRVSDGATPLFIAALSGHLDMCTLLIGAGAEVDAQTNERSTPLLAAANLAKLDVALSVAELLLAHHANVNATTISGITALSLAAERGNRALCKLLLENGAFVDIPRKNNVTPLLMAAFQCRDDVCRLLIEHHADVNVVETFTGSTPLIVAAEKELVGVVEALLTAGANVLHANAAGCTALFAAAQRGYAAIVRTLVFAGSDPQHRTMLGATALISACQKGHVEVARTLLTAGSKTYTVLQGLLVSAMYIAAQSGNVEICRLLLDWEESRELLSRISGRSDPILIAAPTRLQELIPDVASSLNPPPLATPPVALASKMAQLASSAPAGYVSVAEGSVPVMQKLMVRIGPSHDGPVTPELSPIEIAQANGHDAVVSLLRARNTGTRSHVEDPQ
eukprot:TRINITY_DN6903_c0_g1_i2.p1 TRINITY_DN6903_c0_g1~~TRINITY_DN6903_c0_g1_i2.p1  ORF type:complete len:675 (+),score=137.21 TRINITY_DN6903_c0_g1_i2:2087-4111(+)